MKRIEMIRLFNTVKSYDNFMKKKVIKFEFPGIKESCQYTGRDLLTVIKNMTKD